MFFLLLIGCFGGSSSSDDTATDTGWHDDFEWEDGTGDQSDDTTGTDSGSSGTADSGNGSSSDTDSGNGGYTSPDPEDTDTGSTSATATYTVCLTDLDSDVASLSLDAASTTTGAYVYDFIVVYADDSDDRLCASLTGGQDEIFEIDGLVTLDDGTTSEFVYGPGMWDNVGELEMTDHGSSCYVFGDYEADDGVYRCRLPDIWGEP